MSKLKHEAWTGTTYGSGRMHRWLVSVLRVMDVRLLYIFAFVSVVPPAMLIHRKSVRVIYRLFRERLGLGRWRALWMTYRNHCAFSTVIVDRFAMYAGKRFRITIDGYDEFVRLSGEPSGFVQLSSHIGNYELAGYSLVGEKRMNALVFGGEKESVMANRSRMFEGNNIRMIPMTADMSHLFVIDQALSDGEILSIAADRVFGSQKAFALDFLGAKARFPQGPFLISAVRDVPVLFVSVMKVGAKRYHITVRRVEHSAPPGATTRAKALALAERYVELLTEVVQAHPTQWYNYFDFWAN